MFNSLKYVKVLEDKGVPRDQAEAHIQIMTEIIETNLATKQDMTDLRIATQQDFKDLRADLHAVKSDLESKIVQSEYRLTIKLGTIVSVAIGVAVALTKLI